MQPVLIFLVYAASSYIFGKPDVSPQTEITPHRPNTPYGVSKTAAVLLCRYYREVHKLYTVAGILYNHESPRRSAGFVTTQIARAAALAACGKAEPLILKDLNFVVDWGAAEDYVDAMWRTLQQSSGDEYIISTGIPRTVGDFAREAFGAVGLKSEEYVFQQQDVSSGKNKPYIGNNLKIKRMCGWEPTKAFASLVKEMVDAQLLLQNRV
jgi:GDPmannose 4,6-dehydratase